MYRKKSTMWKEEGGGEEGLYRRCFDMVRD